MNSQFDFKQIPFVRILIPYIAGLIAVSVFPEHFFRLLLSFIVLSILLVCIRISSLLPDYFRIISGIILFNGFFICGLLSLSLAIEHHSFPDRKISVCGIVKNKPEAKENTIQIDCSVQEYSDQDKIVEANENVRLYVSTEALFQIPHIGDSICFTAKLQPLKNRGNPKEFDFVSYMRNLKIHYSGYVLYDDVHFGGKSEKYKVRRLASSIQRKIIARFSDYSIKDDELAILSALAAGNRKFLGDEIKSKYAIAGAMHVLAVSGLHVGILFLFLNFILWRRNQTRLFRILRLVAILFAIWFFALITGLSSSVVRASLMFSLFLLGKCFNRQTNPYNILAASALIILVIDPLELFKVGFQFSYLAVIGILYFQPRLFNLISFKYAVFDRIWQLISVSIAAQISILPLSLYYFHQFPVYFWLSNIFVIPLVWLIMVFTILFFLSTSIDLLQEWISMALNALLKILNAIIELVNELPFAAISNIRFEASHLFAAYFLMLILWFSALYHKRIYFIYSIGFGIALFLLINILSYNKFESRREVLVYNYGNSTVVSFINGHKHLLLHNSESSRDSDNIERWNQNFQIGRQVVNDTEKINFRNIPYGSVIKGKEIEIKPTESGIDIHYFNKNIKLVEGDLLSFIDNGSCTVNNTDLLILGNNPAYPSQLNFTHPLPEKIIISRHISKNKSQAWDKFAYNNEIDLFSVPIHGTYHLVLNRIKSYSLIKFMK